MLVFHPDRLLGTRDLVVLDRAGDVHTLARCLNLKVADIRERLAEIDRSQLPTVDQARQQIDERRSKEPERAEELTNGAAPSRASEEAARSN